MYAMEDMPFENLKDKIRKDMAPVKAFAPPWKRASFLFGIWFLLGVLVLLLFGLRHDADALGPWLFWLLPLIQLLTAYAVILLAVRLTVPGSAAAASVLAGLVLLGVAVHLAVAAIMFHFSPVEAAPGKDFHASAVCLIITFCISIFPLVPALILCARGLTSRPIAVGVASGFACGLSAEAVWRLHCPYNDWGHILSSHTLAILAAVVLGWILSFIFFRRLPKKRFRYESNP
jgi:hypothetical protein